MTTLKHQPHCFNDNPNTDFDDLMANLFLLLTQHSLTQCDSVLPQIVAQIHGLTHHDDIECYPNQFRMLLKMQTLWRTRLFKSELSSTKH